MDPVEDGSFSDLSLSGADPQLLPNGEGCVHFQGRVLQIPHRTRPHLDGSLSELSRGLRKELAIAQKETVLSVAPIGKPMTKTQGK